jgi:asparagine synthase (glutamine-hydrolysing)
MCGFVGFLSYRANAYSEHERRAILARMSRAIAHRGPDDAQYYDDGVLSLVYRRLAIVDTRHGAQPFYSEDQGTLLVANGEFYNHHELRRRLTRSHRFASHSDCEVALHAYEEWSTDSFAKLRGMFAMAIWERDARRLTLARDRFGIKPLYVCELEDGVLFGSELKGLLAHPECPRDIDFGALTINPLALEKTPTYIHGVEFLPAASFKVFCPDRPAGESTYWRLESHFASAPYGERIGPYVDHLHDLIDISTREHMLGEYPVALHLSGGLDSSLLATLMARHTKDVPCFSIVERTSYLGADVAAARALTERLGLQWYPVLFNYHHADDDMNFSLDRLEESIWMMDAPRFDLEWIMKERLTSAIREQRPDIKAFLIGQGADEFSGGYSHRLDRPRTSWSKYLSEEIFPMLRDLPQRPYEMPDGVGKDIGPYHRAMSLMQRQLLHHNLWHEDRTSSWQSMEARVPFLDHRIVELLASIPASLHETLMWNKQILRTCMQRIAPSYDTQRMKIGFCGTDDTRSLDIIVHKLAVRAAPAFLEKYHELRDVDFDRQAMISLVRKVVRHDPGFYADGYQLLDVMSKVIFQHQVRSSATSDFNEARRDDHVQKIVADTSWHALDAAMRAQPFISVSWRLTDNPRPPDDVEYTHESVNDGTSRYTLMHAGKIYARVEMLMAPSWLDGFLRNLGKGIAKDFTVKDWLDEFVIQENEFVEMLSLLHQCGFILSPDIMLENYLDNLESEPH